MKSASSISVNGRYILGYEYIPAILMGVKRRAGRKKTPENRGFFSDCKNYSG